MMRRSLGVFSRMRQKETTHQCDEVLLRRFTPGRQNWADIVAGDITELVPPIGRG